jgi:uncharacterized protein YndB with AHSA1/START domain
MSLRIKRVLPARIDEVFDAWTDGDLLARWFVCAPNWTASVTCDVRVGGRYRIEMKEGGELVGVAEGEYLAIERPRRLVFTWTSDGRTGAGVRDSKVTIELFERGESTELTLTHDIAPETAEGRSHHAGWISCLSSLENTLRRGGST